MPNRRQLVKPPFRGAQVNWAHPYAQYLRGFWLFNEGAGLTGINLAAPSNDITLGGSTLPTWATTQYGGGVDTVGVATVSTLLGGTGAVVDNFQVLTWEAFVYLRALSSYSARIVTKAGDGTTTYNSLMFGSSGDILYLNSRATTNLDYETSTSVVAAGNFYHVVATLDKSNDACHIYLNGIEQSYALSQAGSGAYADDTSRGLCFANRPTGDRTLNGTIIYVRYFNAALTSDAVWDLYSNPHALLTNPKRRIFVGTGVTQYTQALAGTLTDSGALTRQTGKALAGTLTDSGALTRLTSKALAGTLTDSGALTKLLSRALAGTLTDSGALTKQTGKATAGTLTDSGALARQTGKATAGTLTDSGALTKQTNKGTAGTLTSSGALSAIRTVLVALAGALTSSGVLIRQTITSKGGTLTSAGSLTKQTGKSVAGDLTSSGALAAIRTVLMALAGTLTSAGELIRQTQIVKGGTLTESGTLTNSVAKALAGVLTSAGDITRQTSKAVAGTLTSAGSIVKQTLKNIAGTLASSGVVSAIVAAVPVKFRGGLRGRDARLTGNDGRLSGRDSKLTGRNINGDV